MLKSDPPKFGFIKCVAVCIDSASKVSNIHGLRFQARMAKLADAADLKSAYKVAILLHVIANK